MRKKGGGGRQALLSIRVLNTGEFLFLFPSQIKEKFKYEMLKRFIAKRYKSRSESEQNHVLG
jgi:hypothetical protein